MKTWCTEYTKDGASYGGRIGALSWEAAQLLATARRPDEKVIGEHIEFVPWDSLPEALTPKETVAPVAMNIGSNRQGDGPDRCPCRAFDGSPCSRPSPDGPCLDLREGDPDFGDVL